MVIFMLYDKKNLTFVLFYYWIYQIRCDKVRNCSASLALYHFSLARLVISIKHEHSCKILFLDLLPISITYLYNIYRIFRKKISQFYVTNLLHGNESIAYYSQRENTPSFKASVHYKSLQYVANRINI